MFRTEAYETSHLDTERHQIADYDGRYIRRLFVERQQSEQEMIQLTPESCENSHRQSRELPATANGSLSSPTERRCSTSISKSMIQPSHGFPYTSRSCSLVPVLSVALKAARDENQLVGMSGRATAFFGAGGTRGVG